MEKECTIIGVFPPPYGGVTVKCKLFCDWLKEHSVLVKELNVYDVNFNIKRGILKLLECITAFRSGQSIVYCLDSKRLKALMVLQCLFEKSFKDTVVLAMGGMFHETVSANAAFCKRLKKVKEIWVETDGMKIQLEEMGFSNIEIFPNPKSEKGYCRPRYSEARQPLHLVFFSQISKEKGVKDIIKLVRILNENKEISYELDFYGHIVFDMKEEFEKFVHQSHHVHYCGVFDATNKNVYQKLNEYDLLLFPTRWFAEGVPGILVEAKMAGLAVVASDHNFNSEIIQIDKGEGFLLEENYPQEMFNIIQRCSRDRELLNKVKENSFQSRKRYALEEYTDMIKKL